LRNQNGIASNAGASIVVVYVMIVVLTIDVLWCGELGLGVYLSFYQSCVVRFVKNNRETHTGRASRDRRLHYRWQGRG